MRPSPLRRRKPCEMNRCTKSPLQVAQNEQRASDEDANPERRAHAVGSESIEDSGLAGKDLTCKFRRINRCMKRYPQLQQNQHLWRKGLKTLWNQQMHKNRGRGVGSVEIRPSFPFSLFDSTGRVSRTTCLQLPTVDCHLLTFDYQPSTWSSATLKRTLHCRALGGASTMALDFEARPVSKTNQPNLDGSDAALAAVARRESSAGRKTWRRR